MNTTYEIQVIQCDREDWMTQLREAVAAELLDVGLHRTVAVAVTETPAAPDSPSVVVYMGSPAAAVSDTVSASVDAAAAAGLVVCARRRRPDAIPG